jgi:hypothetical protein
VVALAGSLVAAEMDIAMVLLIVMLTIVKFAFLLGGAVLIYLGLSNFLDKYL